MRKVLIFAVCILSLGSSAALAVGPNDHCDTVPADRTFTDGRPHLWQTSTAYGSTGCPNGYVVDVTYSALDPLPGTYMSWGDEEPTTQAACEQSCLRLHVFNHYAFADSLPGWLDEGLAIQAQARLDCGGDPMLMPMEWRPWVPGTTNGHLVGSELFRRLEVDHGCGSDCAAEIWRGLVDAHGTDTDLTNAEIKAVFEERIGADLSSLFTLLGIAF